MCKISILIVIYKDKGEMIECLRSVKAQKTRYLYEVILIDNGGNKFEKADVDRVTKDYIYIKSSDNLGYGKGNNLGARHAKGKYLLVLNPDIKLKPGFLNNLCGFLEKNNNVAVVAPILVDEKGRVIKQISAKELTPVKQIFTYSFVGKIFPKNKIKKEFLEENTNSKVPYEVEVIPGSAFLIRKDVFEKVGGFDKNIFLYFEENDLFRRVIDVKYNLYKVPNAKYSHDWHPVEGDEKTKRIFEKSRFYYFRKHYGLLKALIVEMFCRFDKYAAFILLLILLGLFLRLYKLDSVFTFSGEVGHNLLEIKNYILNKEIPLVGPPTSHPWLKFGPLFYWLYGPILVYAKFNPLSYAYFGSIISVLSIPLNYILVNKLFNRNVAIISSLIVAISPLFIEFSKDARFFNIVSILVYPFLLFLYKFAFEDKKYLFFVFLFLGFMLNFHYTPLILLPAIFFLAYTGKVKIKFGFLLKKSLAVFIPLFPLFIYDLENKLIMFRKILLWIPYRIAGFMGLYPKNNFSFNSLKNGLNIFLEFISRSIVDSVFLINSFFSFIVIGYILFIGYELLVLKKKNNSVIFLLIILITGTLAITIHGEPPIHYYLPLFPIPVIVFSHILSRVFTSKYNNIAIIIIVFLTVFNAGKLIKSRNLLVESDRISLDPFFISLDLHKDVASFIVRDSQGEQFALKRNGPYDYFEGDYAQNYQYLLWLYGNEPVMVGDQIITVAEPKIVYIVNESKNINNSVYEKGGISIEKLLVK